MKKQHQIWLDEFLKNCEHSNKSPRTLINYRADIQKFIRWYESHHSKPLNHANAQTIGLYKEYLSSGRSSALISSPSAPLKSRIKIWFKSLLSFRSHNSDSKSQDKLPPPAALSFLSLAVSSRRRHLSAIKNFYEFLKQANEDLNKLFVTNPVKPKLHAIKLKEQDVKNTKLLTEKDWECIVDTVFRPREKLVVHLLYFGGLRLSELCELKISHFDFQNHAIRFVRKGGYVHTLTIQQGPRIFQLLQNFLATREHDSDFLICNKKGKALSSRAMYNLIMKIFLKSHCPTPELTPHSFRKACATNLYRKTKDLLFVRDYLNHNDAKVTQTYIEKHLFEEESQKYLR